MEQSTRTARAVAGQLEHLTDYSVQDKTGEKQPTCTFYRKYVTGCEEKKVTGKSWHP